MSTAEESVITYLTENRNHRVYLITYAQRDVNKFPTKQSFARACVSAFGGNKVEYFAGSEEKHRDGGIHYHVAMKLSEGLRWKYAKDFLEETHGVVVNFRESPNKGMYAGAYGYVSKFDDDLFLGSVLVKHPEPEDIGKNVGAANANAAYRKRRAEARAENAAAGSTSVENNKKKPKAKRVDKLDVIDLIRAKNIRDMDALLAAAEVKRIGGDRDFAKFIINLGKKGRSDLISDAWQMESSIGNVALKLKSRLDIVREISCDKGNCTCPQSGLWLALALDVLERNGIQMLDFSQALYLLLDAGRKKHRNIILVGERNCAKTFLLEPLTLVFQHCFNTPASSQFGWLGVEKAQVIYLNDFRWAPLTVKGGTISWDALLRLLEGGETNLPAPMNSCSDHIKLSKENDVPVFCTSRGVLKFYKTDENEPQTNEHHIENRMMDERWKVFHLKYVFEEERKIECDACQFCFSKLVLASL